MENKTNMDPTPIPYFAHQEIVTRLSFVHEGDMDRADRTNRRLIIALVLSIVLIFATNAVWLYEWMQYDYVAEDEYTSTMYEQDGSGINIMGNRNEVNNGTENSIDEKTDDEKEDQEIISWE